MSNYMEIKRKKQIRRKMKQAVTFFLLAGVFLLWGIYGLLQSDFFNLEEIEVTGISQLTEEEITASSHLIMNRNLFKYNLEEIESNLLSHPYVEQAVLRRKLPNTMEIAIVERVDYAILSHIGSYLVVDMKGAVLRVDDSYLSQELPLITGAVVNGFVLGEQANLENEEELAAALRLIEAAHLSETLENISEINIGTEENIRLITFDGNEVLLGEAEDPVYLMLALQEVLVNLYTNNRRNVIIDMRYQENITVKDREL